MRNLHGVSRSVLTQALPALAFLASIACHDAASTGSIAGRDLGTGRCVAVNARGTALCSDSDNIPFTMTFDGKRTPLGSISDDEVTVGMAIDDAGRVGGYAEGLGGRRAVIYEKGAWRALDGLPADTLLSAVMSVGNDGSIAGYTQSAQGISGFVQQPGKPLPLELLSGRQSAVYASRDGVASGVISTDSKETHGFIIRAGALKEVPTLGGPSSAIFATKADGTGVGAAHDAAGKRHAILVAGGSSELVDLGMLAGGVEAEARGFDRDGQIVGNVTMADGTTVPVRFHQGGTPETLMPTDDQGRPFASASIVAAASNGDMVGWGYTTSATSNVTRAVVWTNRSTR